MLSMTELLTLGHQQLNQLLFSQKRHQLSFGFWGFGLGYFLLSHKRYLWFAASTSKIAQIDKLH